MYKQKLNKEIHKRKKIQEEHHKYFFIIFCLLCCISIQFIYGLASYLYCSYYVYNKEKDENNFDTIICIHNGDILNHLFIGIYYSSTKFFFIYTNIVLYTVYSMFLLFICFATMFSIIRYMNNRHELYKLEQSIDNK